MPTSKANADIANAKPNKLLEDLHVLVTEAEKLLGQADASPSSEAVAALRDRFEAAQVRLAELYGEAKKQAVAGVKTTDAAIRENPYQSLVITAGVALVFGLLLARRSCN